IIFIFCRKWNLKLQIAWLKPWSALNAISEESYICLDISTVVLVQSFKGDVKEGSKLSLSAAKLAVKEAGGKKRIRTPRIIPIPKQGGILPLIPIFAGLSALGSLAGGVAGVATAVNKAKSAQKKLEESQRHNKMMEEIALKGEGLYLKPYRKGLGLYLKPSKN
ncbi:hypothetical protein QE152_g40256, partial [Popillia japonica]